ncbi:hypothetical protein KEM55_000586 [Ascosphaera atra]|nr:hypothetical protein KEM55_000586 [Ascosphaera atra]
MSGEPQFLSVVLVGLGAALLDMCVFEGLDFDGGDGELLDAVVDEPDVGALSDAVGGVGQSIKN